MKDTLRVGMTADVVITVTEDMCPAIDGRVVHRVYSTWSMGHHMELAARTLIQSHLDDDEEAIGSHLTIEHAAPTPVGHTVRVEAETVAVSPREVAFDTRAFHVHPDGGEKLVGTGRQIQRVMARKTLARLIERES